MLRMVERNEEKVVVEVTLTRDEGDAAYFKVPRHWEYKLEVPLDKTHSVVIEEPNGSHIAYKGTYDECLAWLKDWGYMNEWSKDTASGFNGEKGSVQSIYSAVMGDLYDHHECGNCTLEEYKMVANFVRKELGLEAL